MVDAENPHKGCEYASETSDSRAYSIEDYGDFWAGYVEFDDEGWLFHTSGQPNQIEVLETRLQQDINDPKYKDVDFLIIAFIHGWHHNAHDRDCNVHEFRAMLKVANDRYAHAYTNPLIRRRRIIGVYAGWRGESLNIDGLRYTTVLDRRNAAERVAKGDVRTLFATLRKLQVIASRNAGRDDRMRTVVIGHSFVGLIAFNGLSQAVLNELTLTRPDADSNCAPIVQRPPSDKDSPDREAREPFRPPVFPDMLVLINPAFEATRFESIYALGKPIGGCQYPTYPDFRPKVIVATADNDRWTGPAFTFGRSALTLLEAYPKEGSSDIKSLERDANLHAIGFNDRYVTHRLELIDEVPKAFLVKSANAEWKPEPCSPVWVIRAPKEIINGHNGFLYPQYDSAADRQTPYLLNWLFALHSEWKNKNAFMLPQDQCRAVPCRAVMAAYPIYGTTQSWTKKAVQIFIVLRTLHSIIFMLDGSTLSKAGHSDDNT